jgi:hypothetical protein
MPRIIRSGTDLLAALARERDAGPQYCRERIAAGDEAERNRVTYCEVDPCD